MTAYFIKADGTVYVLEKGNRRKITGAELRKYKRDTRPVGPVKKV
jgi:hypothetical protein